MSKRKKTIVEADGTPHEVEVDDGIARRKVVWTKLGEDCRAHSEHGVHAEGDVVETEHADIFVERGFALEVGDALPERSPAPTERTEFKPEGDS